MNSNVGAFYNNGASYNHGFEPNSNPPTNPPTTSLAYNNINPGNVDLGQFQNPLLHQRLNDVGVRTHSPGFQYPSYQTSSVVPAKRPHPAADGVGASSTPVQDTLVGSRSQTPQQIPFPNQHNGHNGQSIHAPNPYQHSQQTAASQASPSPHLQNYPFGSQPTTGPPPQTSYVHQLPADHPSTYNSQHPQRTPPQFNLPQNNQAQAYMLRHPSASGFMQVPISATAAVSAGLSGPFADLHNNTNASMQPELEAMQRRYQMQLQQVQQQRLQSGSGMLQNGQQPHPMSTMRGPGPGASNGNVGDKPPQLQVTAAPASKGAEQSFMSTFINYTSSHGHPLNPDPRICGRQVNYYDLFQAILKLRIVLPGPNQNKWHIVAAAMDFPESQYPHAPTELMKLYQQNMAPYVNEYLRMVQRRKMAQVAQMRQQAQIAGQPQMAPPQSSQTQQTSVFNAQATLTQASNSLPEAEKTVNPIFQQNVASMELRTTLDHGRSGSLHVRPSSPPQPSYPPVTTPVRIPAVKDRDQMADLPTHGSEDALAPVLQATVDENTEYKPNKRTLTTYGGLDITRTAEFAEKLAMSKSGVSPGEPMPTVDVHTLTMMLQSGIDSQVRYALDNLVLMSTSRQVLSLEECQDLVDSLIDCAEQQLEALADDAGYAPDDLELLSIHDLSHMIISEVDAIYEPPEFGSELYELNHAADRLLAISTVLRNLSFFEVNQNALASSSVVGFISASVRLLGHCQGLLKTARNMSDYMKDIVTLLSNTADKIELSSKDDAVALLHFLLAFGPARQAAHSASQAARFSSYDPSVHHYLPSAIDSLAKLLARDDPNRIHYRSIFSSEISANPPFDLLTRAFALAISPIPHRSDQSLSNAVWIGISKSREAFFSQGMLAADILASLAPGPDHQLARSWLESEDGWAPKLLHIIMLLAMNHTSVPQQRHPTTGAILDYDPQKGFMLITHRALSMLRRLAEKTARSKDGRRLSLARLLPPEWTIVSAMLNPSFDAQASRQVLALARLEG